MIIMMVFQQRVNHIDFDSIKENFCNGLKKGTFRSETRIYKIFHFPLSRFSPASFCRVNDDIKTKNKHPRPFRPAANVEIIIKNNLSAI